MERKNMVFKITFVLIIIFAYSCTSKKIDFEQDQLLVLNGIQNQYFPLKLNVTSTKDILDDNKYIYIDNAIIDVFEVDEYIGQMSYSEYGDYFLEGFYPQPGKKYSISLSAKGYTDANCQFSMPDQTYFTITRLSINKRIRTDTVYNKIIRDWEIRYDTLGTSNFRILINDDINSDDFYRIDIRFNNLKDIPQYILSFQSNIMIKFTAAEPDFYYSPYESKIPSGIENFGLSGVFCDRIDMNNIGIEFTSHISSAGNYVYVVLFKISEEYFNLIKTLAVSDETKNIDNEKEASQLNPLLSPDMIFFEPVIFPSNIDNGAGLCTGITASVDSLFLVY